jgi:hypothetical protein
MGWVELDREGRSGGVLRRSVGALLTAGLLLIGCSGGGSDGPPSCDGVECDGRLVTFSWTANRESRVNTAGGGYEVQISGLDPVLVPFVSGATSPTSVAIRLPRGNYNVSVRAFAALDAQGGTSRTYSDAAQSSVSVP